MIRVRASLLGTLWRCILWRQVDIQPWIASFVLGHLLRLVLHPGSTNVAATRPKTNTGVVGWWVVCESRRFYQSEEVKNLDPSVQRSGFRLTSWWKDCTSLYIVGFLHTPTSNYIYVFYIDMWNKQIHFHMLCRKPIETRSLDPSPCLHRFQDWMDTSLRMESAPSLVWSGNSAGGPCRAGQVSFFFGCILEVEFSGTPNNGNGIGIVWEAYQKGVPLLGDPISGS